MELIKKSSTVSESGIRPWVLTLTSGPTAQTMTFTPPATSVAWS